MPEELEFDHKNHFRSLKEKYETELQEQLAELNVGPGFLTKSGPGETADTVHEKAKNFPYFGTKPKESYEIFFIERMLDNLSRAKGHFTDELELVPELLGTKLRTIEYLELRLGEAKRALLEELKKEE